MKFGIIIYSNDPEAVWNAFRLGSVALNQGNQVNVFLLAKGVESESLDSEKFKVTEQMKYFTAKKGKIYACGTCLKIRNAEASELCQMSTMNDLYELIRDSDKVVSF